MTKQDKLDTQIEVWRILTREKVLTLELGEALAEEETQTIMWDCVSKCDEMLVPVFLQKADWPLDRRLPKGADKRKLGSVLRNALSAWIMDDPSLSSWKDGTRPALYLSVTILLQMLTFQERSAIIGASLEWANEPENKAITKPEVIGALFVGLIELRVRQIQEMEKEMRRQERKAKKEAQVASFPGGLSSN